MRSGTLCYQLIRLFSRVIIQDLQLLRSVEKLLMVILTVDSHEETGEIAQLPGSHILAVTFAGTPSVHDLTLQYKLPVILRTKSQLFYCISHRFPLDLKDELYKRIFRACPDHRGIGFSSESEIDTADEYGFSRTGLACQDIQTPLELYLLFFDECQIFYMKTNKHTRSSPA